MEEESLAPVSQSPAPQQFPQQCSLQLQPIPNVIPSAVPQSPCRDSESSPRPRAGGRSTGVQQDREVTGEELWLYQGGVPQQLWQQGHRSSSSDWEDTPGRWQGRMGAAGQLLEEFQRPAASHPIPSHPSSGRCGRQRPQCALQTRRVPALLLHRWERKAKRHLQSPASHELSPGEIQSVPKCFQRFLLCTRWLSPTVCPHPQALPT